MEKEDWRYISGNEGSDRWVMISKDEKVFIIGEWDSTEEGVSKSIRIENNRNLVPRIVEEEK